jgi:hypothetical protein
MSIACKLRSLINLLVAAIIAVPVAIIAEVITFELFVSIRTPGVLLASYWILPALHKDILDNLWPLALIIDSIMVFSDYHGYLLFENTIT